MIKPFIPDDKPLIKPGTRFNSSTFFELKKHNRKVAKVCTKSHKGMNSRRYFFARLRASFSAFVVKFCNNQPELSEPTRSEMVTGTIVLNKN
jgi:hypothetical protein